MKFLLFTIFLFPNYLVHGGEIANYFHDVVVHSKGFGSEDIYLDAKILTGKPESSITEIGIEHTTCFGTCPSFSFSVKRDGSLSYDGLKYVTRLGHYSGKIDEYSFNAVARAIEELDFMKMKDEYVGGATDFPSTYTLVVMGSKKKVIREYGHFGPAKLHIVERLIDGLLSEAKWDPPKAVRKTK